MKIKQYSLIIGCTLAVATYQSLDPDFNTVYNCTTDFCGEKLNYGSLSGSIIQDYDKEQDLYQMNAESLISGSYFRNNESGGDDVFFVYQSFSSFDYTKG